MPVQYMVVVFFILLFSGVPIAWCMGFSASLFIFLEGIPLSMIAQRFFSNTQSFPFLAVPFFILAGNLMLKSKVAKAIIDLSNSFVRHLPGGLALVSIVTSMFMAGVSGSSVADASGVGSVLIPAMKEEGYDSSFSTAINATSSVVGIIIPPSSTMVILGWLANISIARLFLGGAIPGFLFSLLFFIITIYIAKRRNYPTSSRPDLKEILINLKNSILALILPIFIVVGLVGGIATVTEIAALSSIYSLFLGVVIYRNLDLSGIIEALKKSTYATSIIMLIVCTSYIFNWVLIMEDVPQQLAGILIGFGLSANMLLAFMVFTMLVAGTFMDLVPNLFLFVPVYFPIATDVLGMDPIHFGVLTVITFAIGLFTPPVGTTLYISCHLADIGIEESLIDLIPFFIAGAAICFIVAFFPQLTLWLPELLM